MPNYVESLHARDAGLFTEVDVTFNDRVNVIIGPNGSGKTSILRLLAFATSHNYVNHSRWGGECELWINTSLPSGKTRIGYGPGFATPDAHAYRKGRVQNWGNLPNSANYKNLWNHQISATLPGWSILFISAHRRIEYKQIGSGRREELGEAQASVYREQSVQFLEGASIHDIKQWIITRYLIEGKTGAEVQTANWRSLISKLPDMAPDGVVFSYSKTELDFEPQFLVNEKLAYLEELSSGFKSMLTIVASITNWCESTAFSGGGLIDEAEGTVVIDEVDLHLHPEWQVKVMKSLRSIFPKMQFIVTTHSPHVITSVGAGEVLPIRIHDGVVKLAPDSRDFSGWRYENVLEDLMGMRNLHNSKVYSLLASAAKAHNDGRLEDLIDISKEVALIVHPSDPVVEVLELQISELRLQVSQS